MTTWNYIRGSEKDFEGAPDWATMRTHTGGNTYFAESHSKGAKICGIIEKKPFKLFGKIDVSNILIVAQREPVTNATPVATNDDINHPLRYTKDDIECIDAIKAATVGKTGIEAVCVANVVKYLWRYEEKNGLEDVKKARWYLERLISEMEGE
jgi:hypothetical protein